MNTDAVTPIHNEDQPLQAQMTFRLSVLSKLLDRQMADIAARQGLGLIGYRLLATAQAFGPLTAADLGRHTCYDKAAVSRAVSDLENKGWFEGAADPTHGRRRILRLTPAGQAQLDAAHPAVTARREALASVLDAKQEAALAQALDALLTHLDQARSLAGPENSLEDSTGD